MSTERLPAIIPDQVRLAPDLAKKVSHYADGSLTSPEDLVARVLSVHFDRIDRDPDRSQVVRDPDVSDHQAGVLEPLSGVERHSALSGPLIDTFLRRRIRGATELTRISGYFRSTLFHAIRDDLSDLQKIRLLCNAELDPRDIITAQCAKGSGETIPDGDRFHTLHELLRSGRLEVRVVDCRERPFLHGKAGVIRYADGRTCTFSGSANDTLTAWTKNYEIVWEDPSEEAAAWFDQDFATIWETATPLDLATSTLISIDEGASAVRGVDDGVPYPGDQVDPAGQTGGDERHHAGTDPRTRILPDVPELQGGRVLRVDWPDGLLVDPDPKALLSEALVRLCRKLSTTQEEDVRIIPIHVGVAAQNTPNMTLHHDRRLGLWYPEPKLRDAILGAWKAARAIGEPIQITFEDHSGQKVPLVFDPAHPVVLTEDGGADRERRLTVKPGMAFRVRYEDNGKTGDFYVVKGENDRFIGKGVTKIANGSPLAVSVMNRASGDVAELHVGQAGARDVRILDVWAPEVDA